MVLRPNGDNLVLAMDSEREQQPIKYEFCLLKLLVTALYEFN